MDASIQGVNIRKTATSAITITLYFEKYKILEILTKLIFEIAIQRPQNVSMWLAENIKRLAYPIITSRTFILTPPGFDNEKLLDLFARKAKIPTLVYDKRKTNKTNTDEIIKDFENFLEKYKLDDRNRIYINFPKNCKQLQRFNFNEIRPSNIIEIKSDSSPPQKLDETCHYAGEFECIRNFYKDIYRIIRYGSKLTNKNRHQTVKEIFHKLVYEINKGDRIPRQLLRGGYCYRILLYGRHGSGKSSQAIKIVERFNVVHVDTSLFFPSHLAFQSGTAEALRERICNNENISLVAICASINKRLLYPDCLERGWVLENFPYNLKTFQLLFEEFQTPPNKIILLHCRERQAIRRAIKKWRNKYGEDDVPDRVPSDYYTFFKKKMDFYNLNRNEIYEYLKNKHFDKTFHINGVHSKKTVEKAVMAALDQDSKIITTFL